MEEVTSMKENCYWAIVCDNFCGSDDVYYFTSHEVAVKNFLTIVEKYKDAKEFERDGNSCMWFDSSFNEYSTYIYLMKKPLPAIHDDIIF